MQTLWQRIWGPGRWWLAGLLWTTGAGAWPVLVAAYDGWERYSDPTDWMLLQRLMIAGMLREAIGYWRKHQKSLRAIVGEIPLPPADENA